MSLILILMIVSITSFMTGVLVMFGYMLYRCMKNMEDKSNLTNALRLLSHVVLHPNDFLLMRYPDGKAPFWYSDKDELSEVVQTRPRSRGDE